MKAASSPGGTCPQKKEHQLPRDLQKERGNETTQGMERSVDRGGERARGPLGPLGFPLISFSV